MKRTFSIVASVMLAVSGFSQEAKTPQSDVKLSSAEKSRSTQKSVTNKNKSVTISKRAGEDQQVHNAQYYLKEIEKVDKHLEAIDSKVDFVSNDPNEKAIAEKNGWFEKMEATKSRLIIKKKSLQSKLEQL